MTNELQTQTKQQLEFYLAASENGMSEACALQLLDVLQRELAHQRDCFIRECLNKGE